MNRRLHQHGFDPRAGSPPDWLSLILASGTEGEVAATARDYLATWTPEEIAQLPKDCRPGRIRDGEDIGGLAFRLARAHCFNDEDGVLEKMMVFFTHASTRIAQLEAQTWSSSSLSSPFGAADAGFANFRNTSPRRSG